ncbi:MAG: DUF5612 domain-containing protein [Ignavibacteriales bacterium]|nr:DUF5612 domain-containing protein [Ignavibacteriales bacterium]
MLRDIAGAVAKERRQHRLHPAVRSGTGHEPGQGLAFTWRSTGPEEVIREMVEELGDFDSIFEVSIHEPFEKIFGSRVIIIGGGAQVAQVAVGAVSEADRHNLRGERISVDTIPLVGEAAIADAVSAVSRSAARLYPGAGRGAHGRAHHRGGEETSGGRDTGHRPEDGRIGSRSGRSGGDGPHPGRHIRGDACGQHRGLRYIPGAGPGVLALSGSRPDSRSFSPENSSSTV